MSSDDPDKTVFRQPSVDGDRTIIRPMPGGRGGAPSQEPTQPIPEPVQQQSQPQPVRPDVQSNASGSHHDGTQEYFRTNQGLNPLVNSASTLIAVFEKTRQSMTHPNVGGLHQRMVSEIKEFDSKAKEVGIKPEIVLASRYALCAALDEAVLNTPWGSESAWPQRTLLSIFHNETAGGEKFFQILERMKEQPAENLYILELLYILLSLGFEGKYRVIHRGRDTIEKVRDELFTIIRRNRGDYERALSPSWEGLGRTKNTLTSYIPAWVVASVVAAFLVVSYSGFRVWLYNSSKPVVTKLEKVADIRGENHGDVDQSLDMNAN